MSGIEINYSIMGGLKVCIITNYDSVEKSVLNPFKNDLDEKQEVKERLFETGFNTEGEMLQQYLICFYGGNDNRHDYSGGKTVSDFCHCGMRGNCINEGFPGLCSLANIDNEIISPAELESLQLSAYGNSVKQIADKRYRSTHTIVAQERTIRQKMRVNSIGAAIGKAVKYGLVQI